MPPLDAYRAKRRFAATPEPEGGSARDGSPIFVVQKHRATRLHYDLRLQVGDTLRSWAVPQGPSLDPKVRRFAKLVEDHPLDYASFEGAIPEGNYGAGEVIVWDRGTWATPSPDPEAAIAAGEIKFRLSGEKLSGGWMLKRLPDDPTNWLLIKERDPAARPISEFDVVRDRPESVITGRRVEEVAAPVAAPPRGLKPPKAAKIRGAKPAPIPDRVPPMLATSQSATPEGSGWVHEIKYDGYRTLAFIEAGEVRMITRNGLDWTNRYGALARAFKQLACTDAVIDGEVAVQDPRGVTSIHLLEQALSEGRTHAMTFFAFDLLHLDGYDLRAATLLDRKKALAALLDPVLDARSPIQLSEHVEGDGDTLFQRACEMGLEGVVSKRADARYVSGRSDNWVKVKRVEFDDFVVIGFTVNAVRSVAAVIVADDTPDGLVYAGKAGSGIGDARARELYAMFAAAIVERAAAKAPRMKEAIWVEPRWLARIGHRGRTTTNAPRQPVLLDIRPRIVRPPRPASAPLKRRLVSDGDLAAIRITNPDREMIEGGGATKLDVALHYARVGDWMLPEILDRPITLVRCTTGKAADAFYQRHAFAGLPEGVARVELADEETRAAFIAIAEPRGYLALAQFGVVEMHAWGCRIDDAEHPDRMVIDLDPDEALGWMQVCEAAEILRDRLKGLGFSPFLRTTGGKGLHLVCALTPGANDWPTMKGFAEAFARQMAIEAPQLFSAIAAKAKRKGRIYIDYLRNARGATAVSSFSLRARPMLPVATPIEWGELRNLSGGDAFNIRNIGLRLETIRNDPWLELQESATTITPRMRREVGLKT